jgi:malonyl-CoA O-methyltransferase
MSQEADSPVERHVPTREGYDQWSRVYDGDGNPLILLEEEVVGDRLGNVRGLQVLDVGCGTGRHSIRLADAGALVTGIDFSDGMLARARSKAGSERVRWIAHDLATPLPFAEGAFERVLCALVLDHVGDVDFLFAQMARACAPAPRGRVVISVMHPAMTLRGVQARFTDPSTGERVMPASVRHTVSDYVLGASRAGLRITHMEERDADADLARRAPRAEKHLGWPLLFVMVAERC